VKPDDLIDPRGIPAAPRRPVLDGKRLLLLDNGKPGVGAYAVIADALRSGVPDVAWRRGQWQAL